MQAPDLAQQFSAIFLEPARKGCEVEGMKTNLCEPLTSNNDTAPEQNITLHITGEITIRASALAGIAMHIQTLLPASKPEAPKPQFGDTQFVTKSGLPKVAFTMKETAEILGISYVSLYRLMKRGLLKSSSALRHKKITRAEIERFLKETTE